MTHKSAMQHKQRAWPSHEALLHGLDAIVVHLRPCGRSHWKVRLPNDRKLTLTRSIQALPSWLSSKILSESSSGARPLKIEPHLRKSLYFARAYLEVIFDHFSEQLSGVCPNSLLSIIKVAESWPTSNFEKCAKWVLCAPMAAFLRNDLPVPPLDDIQVLPFFGKMKAFLRHRLRSRQTEKKNLHFWNSVLQGVKRACAPPDTEMVEENLKKHASALSKSPPPRTADLKDRFLNLLSTFRAQRLRMPRMTQSSSYSTTRTNGGKIEEVIRKHNGVWHRDLHCCDLQDDGSRVRHRNAYHEPLHNLDLISMVEPWTWSKASSTEHVQSVYGRDIPSLGELRHMALEEDVDVVRAVGLLESLKVRVITTGSAVKSTYLETLRKPIHDFLREIPCMKLIGSPKVRGSDLEDLLSREAKLGVRFPNWVSGDYAAATDNLSMHSTRDAIVALLQKLGREEDQGLLESTLTNCRLEYPFLSPDSEDGNFHQSNGQLMGNPMSFPILCLVNLAGYQAALEEYLGFQVDTQDLPVLVNGDDILFRADDRLYRMWKQRISDLGLELSVGKCYVSNCFATLNSQAFLQKKTVEGSVYFEEITYTNPGLLLRDGVTGDKKRVSTFSAPQVLDEGLKGAWSRERYFGRFLRLRAEAVNKCTRHGLFNLFLPRSSGGLGVRPWGLQFHVTRWQKWLAWALSEAQNRDPMLFASRQAALKRKPHVSLGFVSSHSRAMHLWVDAVRDPIDGSTEVLLNERTLGVLHHRLKKLESDSWSLPQDLEKVTDSIVESLHASTGHSADYVRCKARDPKSDRRALESWDILEAKDVTVFKPGSLRNDSDSSDDEYEFSQLSGTELRQLWKKFPPELAKKLYGLEFGEFPIRERVLIKARLNLTRPRVEAENVQEFQCLPIIDQESLSDIELFPGENVNVYERDVEVSWVGTEYRDLCYQSTGSASPANVQRDWVWSKMRSTWIQPRQSGRDWSGDSDLLL